MHHKPHYGMMQAPVHASETLGDATSNMRTTVMKAFQVRLNGQQVCTAGVEEGGIASVVLSWWSVNPPHPPSQMAAFISSSMASTRRVVAGSIGQCRTSVSAMKCRLRFLKLITPSRSHTILNIPRERRQ